MRKLLLLLLMLSFSGVCGVRPAQASQPPAANSIIFDESTPGQLTLRNDHYQLTVSRSNGSLLALVDRVTGADLTLGSRHGCLWGVVFSLPSEIYRGGCSFAPEHIRYRWDATTNELTFTYEASAGDQPALEAVATFHASEAAYFDLSLALVNRSPVTATNVLLPSDLLFADQSVQAGYLPAVLPGVRLQPAFFTDFMQGAGRQYVVTYPSDQAFADYLALQLTGGHLALYTVNPSPNPVQPVALGFVDNETTQPATFFAYHNLHTWIPPQASWQSPQVRIVVGQPPATTMLAYRTDNGLDHYPTLADKLGDQLDLYAQAPLLKHDSLRPFQTDQAELSQLPTPSLLHLVAFQPGGHDEHYPDFLPPDPRWGSLADFQALVHTARQHGILVMPYLNPTWWDDESPTLRNLPAPLQLADVAALNHALQPISETYGGKFGYVVSPSAPFVQQRLADLLAEWQTVAPVDCFFEDQLGARAWLRDFNSAAATPQTYSDGWLAHAATHADRCLMTEMGWDRLAEYVVGFHGTQLTWAREFDLLNRNFGPDNWAPYPLSLWLLHDKVLTYQHDLSLHTMTEDTATLAYNLAFGNLLSYNWQYADNQPLTNPWLPLVAKLQRLVVARYVGQPLEAFDDQTPDLTRTRFPGLDILVNWSPQNPYALDQHRIAPGGFYVTSDDQHVSAGLFAGFYNDSYLSAGEHLLLIQRTAEIVTVYQLLGEASVLRVDAPADWQLGQPLYVSARDAQGQVITTVDHWQSERTVNFVYLPQRNNKPVDAYRISLHPVQPAEWAVDPNSSCLS